MIRKLYVEIVDPRADSDDMPAWSGVLNRPGFGGWTIVGENSALEPGFYAGLAEDRFYWIVQFANFDTDGRNWARLINPWSYDQFKSVYDELHQN